MVQLGSEVSKSSLQNTDSVHLQSAEEEDTGHADLLTSGEIQSLDHHDGHY